MTDYTKEAERLIIDQIAAKFVSGNNVPVDSVRITADEWSALLAHIERGRIPDGIQVVDLGFRFDGSRQHHIPRLTVEFDPVPVGAPNDAKGWKDRDAVADMLAAPAAPDHSAAKPAEVPMPECYVTSGGRDLFSEEQMRAYGDAREAAGYARGLRDAVRDADIEALRLYVRALCKAVDAATDFIGTVAGGASWWDDVWADHAAALDRARERISQAALRGEVKR